MAKSPDEFSEIVAKVLSDNTAQSVLNYLKALESNRDRVRARWIWELLQNARDASADSDMELVACIEQSEDKLVFEHNGESFSLEEIAHLIYHGSTKTEDEETIGQYGSGFLTTHLLSPEISVSGRITDGGCFAFRMRREISSVSDLSQSMRDAERKFKDSLSRKSTNDDLTTKFQYPLSNDVLGVVDAGIASLSKCAPFVLVFNKNFSIIDIKTPDGSTNFTVTERNPLKVEKISLEKIVVLETKNGNQEVREYLLAYDDGTSIAIPVKCDEDGQRCLPLHDTPRLFLGFPMIGTESFSFPAVINSLRFTPTEDRDGVYLGQGDNQTNIDNQAVIETAGELLIELLGFAASSNLGNTYLLGEFLSIQPQTWLKQDWLQNYFKESLIPEILKTPAILSEDGVISAEESVIPFTKETEERSKNIKFLWDLLNDITNFQKKLPLRNESDGWCKSAESWADIIECEVTDLKEVIDGSKLAIYVKEKSGCDDENDGQLEKFRLFLREEIDAVDWLNRFYKFLYDYGFGDVIRNHPIILAQDEYLDMLANLHRDQCISEELKDIANLLEWKMQEELRDIRLDALKEEVGAGDWDDDYVVEKLVKHLQDRADKNPDILFAEASARLFSWIVGQESWTLLHGFPVFAQESDGDSRRVIRLENDAEEDVRPLAPVSAWVEDLQQFSDLFPRRHTLADEFFESTPDPVIWQTLDKKGFLRRSVMITKNLNVSFDKFLPHELMTDDEEHKTSEHITVSNIAFLTKENTGIMDRVRQSQHLARLFWLFITEWLAPRDLIGLEIKEAPCICESSHRYYPAQWLIPLKERRWIPRGERRSEQATAQSLANLLRDSEWDSSSLSEIEEITRLLDAIGVSRFDLMRELFLPDDDTRAAVNNVFVEMLQATDGNVAHLSEAHQYLIYLKEDPNLSKIIEEHRDHSRQVRENQNLGTRVEYLVKRCLEKEGFIVRRTGIGHDFEIEAEDLVRLELKRSERTWLVEVKATRGQGIRMTATQARTAESEGDRFLLCVVPIPSGTSEPELNIEDTMMFVEDMGSRVASLCDDLANLQQLREDVTADESQGVRLEVEAGTARIRVAASVWQDCGFPLAELSDRLK